MISYNQSSKGDALEAAIGSTQLLNEVAVYDLRQFDSTRRMPRHLNPTEILPIIVAWLLSH